MAPYSDQYFLISASLAFGRVRHASLYAFTSVSSAGVYDHDDGNASDVLLKSTSG